MPNPFTSLKNSKMPLRRGGDKQGQCHTRRNREYPCSELGRTWMEWSDRCIYIKQISFASPALLSFLIPIIWMQENIWWEGKFFLILLNIDGNTLLRSSGFSNQCWFFFFTQRGTWCAIMSESCFPNRCLPAWEVISASPAMSRERLLSHGLRAQFINTASSYPNYSGKITTCWHLLNS